MSSSAIIAYLDCLLYVEETMTTIHIDLYNNSNSKEHIMKAEKDSIDIIDRNMAGFDAWMNRVSFSFDELD